jgi:hypothetical protein
MLWHGKPHDLLNKARSGTIEVFSSQAVLADLKT